jgi:hypothetical protein
MSCLTSFLKVTKIANFPTFVVFCNKNQLHAKFKNDFIKGISTKKKKQ